jgi:hypothetical protein
MTALTCLRASAAAAGPAVSRTRHGCISVGRVGAIVFIGFLSGRFELIRESLATLHDRSREARAGTDLLEPVARQMLLQLAVRDIGQLTDLYLRQPDPQVPGPPGPA